MSARKPNILWIVTTQWRAQSFGYAGDLNARTPVLDQLAAESVNYGQAVTPHPFGPFARAALLTGKSSPENSVVDYYDPLPEEARTIAHEMAEEGYRTAYFGKWHLGPKNRGAALVGATHAKTVVPENRRGGFDYWEGFEGGFLLNDPWLHGTSAPVPMRYEGYQSDILCDRSSQWIMDEGVTCRPWFAVVSLESPHPPYEADAGGVMARDPSSLSLRDNVPLGSETESRARKELVGYYAHIEATDRAIGRLLAEVSREDTIIAFTSVHGDMHGSHGLFRKGWPHEESVRVPLLVRHPQGLFHQDDTPVSLRDLPEMTKTWAREEEWSTESEYAEISMPSVVSLPDQCDRLWRGVRSREHKLVVNADGTPWLFFDLKADPDELHNLVQSPEYLSAIQRLLARL